MTPQTIFVLVMGVAALNGMLHMMAQSGLFILLIVFAPIWWPEVFGFSITVLAYATSLLISTATLMLGGVPAAVFERLRGQQEPSAASMWLWLAGAVGFSLLTLPTLAFRIAA